MRLGMLAVLALVVLASGCSSTQPGEDNTETPDTETGTETPEQEPGASPETSAPSEQTEPDQVVYYTSQGFQPGTVTVDSGDKVVWRNNASTGMWVGSDRHPTHTNYAGTSLREHCSGGDQNSAAFDQCSTGDVFSFTFEKTGEWGYHNHVAPGDTGTVVVQ